MIFLCVMKLNQKWLLVFFLLLFIMNTWSLISKCWTSKPFPFAVINSGLRRNHQNKFSIWVIVLMHPSNSPRIITICIWKTPFIEMFWVQFITSFFPLNALASLQRLSSTYHAIAEDKLIEKHSLQHLSLQRCTSKRRTGRKT